MKEDAGKYNILDDFNYIMPLLISSIALLMAILPEGTALAHSICLVSYNYLKEISRGRIVYQSINSLEVLGQVNCLFIDITIWT